MSRRVLTVLGTRPEAIKLAPVVRALAASSDFESQLCTTGQHREMVRQMCELFALQPDYSLDVMSPGQSLNQLAARLLLQLDGVLTAASPDILLVQGDTTTAFCAALAAFHRRIPVGHVEAGLRTGDLTQPFPEEASRQMISRLAHWHFAPTDRAAANLRAEQVPAERTAVTGNTVIDALHWMAQRLKAPEVSASAGRRLAALGFAPAEDADRPDRRPDRPDRRPDRRWILVTGHRRESWGEGIAQLCEALMRIAALLPGAQVVFPVHLNPQVREPVHRALGGVPGVHLLPPIDYELFVWLMSRSWLVISDSGGVQEEAPALDVPVLVTRTATERVEAQEAGTVRMVGPDADAILSAVRELSQNPRLWQAMARAPNPYGDGTAAERILQALLEKGG